MIIVSHESALEYWRSAAVYRHAQSFSRVSLTNLRPLEVDDIRQVALEGSKRPIDCLAFSAGDRHRTKKVKTHFWCRGLPPKSLVEVSRDHYVCSPEFCFLQLANELPFAALMRLGLELCGTYSLDAAEGKGFSERGQLLTKKRLSTFLSTATGAPGVKKARRATRYIVEGSASPMETIVALLLCLPSMMGGYGLPLPTMNAQIPLPHKLVRITDKNNLFCDLFWPESKTDVEYDSDAFHTDPNEIVRDAQRRNVLGYLGIGVITITRKQVFDYAEFNRVAHIIAKVIGSPIRRRDENRVGERLALRRELLDFHR